MSKDQKENIKDIIIPSSSVLVPSHEDDLPSKSLPLQECIWAEHIHTLMMHNIEIQQR